MSHSLSIREPGLAEYLAEIKKYPMLSEVEELELTTRIYTTQDMSAAHSLVISHLRLVAKLAFKMKGYGLAIMDLISEGAIGLMRAVKKFNPELGFRFSTYATWWIKASINEFIIKSWSLVKIGTSQIEQRLFFRLRGLKNKILAVHGKTNLSSEDTSAIAKSLSVKEKDVIEMDIRLASVLSLDYQSDEEESSMLEQLADTRDNQEVSIAEEQEDSCQKELLNNALATLSQREQEILAARFNDAKITLVDLSKKYNISSERIRQIEGRALEKVRAFCLTPQVSTRNLI